MKINNDNTMVLVALCWSKDNLLRTVRVEIKKIRSQDNMDWLMNCQARRSTFGQSTENMKQCWFYVIFRIIKQYFKGNT